MGCFCCTLSQVRVALDYGMPWQSAWRRVTVPWAAQQQAKAVKQCQIFKTGATSAGCNPTACLSSPGCVKFVCVCWSSISRAHYSLPILDFLTPSDASHLLPVGSTFSHQHLGRWQNSGAPPLPDEVTTVVHVDLDAQNDLLITTWGQGFM